MKRLAIVIFHGDKISTGNIIKNEKKSERKENREIWLAKIVSEVLPNLKATVADKLFFKDIQYGNSAIIDMATDIKYFQK